MSTITEDQHRRLLRLQEMWKTVDPNTIDLSGWYCGTHCCAAGFAAQQEEFNKEGFYAFNSGGCVAYKSVSEYPHAYLGMRAVDKFFGTSHLFDSLRYSSEEIKGLSDYQIFKNRLDSFLLDCGVKENV